MMATDISHRFGERVALDGVSLTVPAGSVVGLLGPNGAGKSTFMRILFGVLQPDEGRVQWDGRDATPSDRREWGYMPQERGLDRDMRVLDHLVWMARLHGMERTAAVREASVLLERLGIDDRADEEIKNLSGGMAQRVQLAAAMVHDPPVLVLDEPFAGLDPTAVGFLSEVVLAHAAAGGRVLFSSHQLDLVEDLCETITMIDHGRVVLAGDVRSLKRSSDDRYLHVDIDVPDDVIERTGSAVVERNATGTRLRLAPGENALDLLDAIRVHGAVTEFGVDAPRLSELFRDATESHP